MGNFSWEEVNHIVRGGNYGWPLNEGVCTANCAGFIDPIHAYPHNGSSAAVTGGPIYRAGMFPPEYQGDLFFSDYAQGFIKHANLDAAGQVTSVEDFDDQAGSVVDMKVAPDGSLYYITYFPGALYRVSFNTTSHLPVANAAADVTEGVEPLTVQFSSAGSNDPDGDPLSYHWDLGDGTTSTAANPTKTYPDKGVYTVRLTVSAAGDAVPAPPIVVQVGVPPELTVAFPTEGQLYRAGDTITYNAFASDAAGFDLDDGDIKTTVRLHHGTHFHPFVGPLTGRAGSFTVPTTGEPSADTSYEVTVTATDANGLSASKVVNILPHKSVIGLASSPSGLGAFVDGIPVSTPHQVTGVEGFEREISAPLYAVAQDGTELQFAGWSDGKPIRHTIVTPVDDTTYTATYGQRQPFTAEYYDNMTFSGAPVVTREETDIDFDWGNDSPDPATARQSLRGPLDQDARVRCRSLHVQDCGRRRCPAVHRRQAGDQPLAGLGGNRSHVHRRPRRGPAHDQVGLRGDLRWRAGGARRRGRTRSAGRHLPGGVLELVQPSRDPRHESRTRPRRGGDRPRLGS